MVDEKFATISIKIKLYRNPTSVTDTENILRGFMSRIGVVSKNINELRAT